MNDCGFKAYRKLVYGSQIKVFEHYPSDPVKVEIADLMPDDLTALKILLFGKCMFLSG